MIIPTAEKLQQRYGIVDIRTYNIYNIDTHTLVVRI